MRVNGTNIEQLPQASLRDLARMVDAMGIDQCVAPPRLDEPVENYRGRISAAILAESVPIGTQLRLVAGLAARGYRRVEIAEPSGRPGIVVVTVRGVARWWWLLPLWWRRYRRALDAVETALRPHVAAGVRYLVRVR